MSWYLIVLFIILYIVMCCITAIILSRFAESSDPQWIALGMAWPAVLMCVPFVAVILLVAKIFDKYGYKEE
jgi:hypothetical protein